MPLDKSQDSPATSIRAKLDHLVIDADDFWAFTFANAAELHASMNIDFFESTAVKPEVAKLISKG